MKLLVFSPYYPPHMGGLESHAAEFNQQLAQKNYSITVFTHHLPSSVPPEEQQANQKIKIIRFPAWEIIPNYPLPRFWSLKFWKLFFHLYRENPDIVISRTRFFLTSLLALIYAKTKRKKLMHIEHGSDFVKLSSKFKNFIAKIYDYTFGWLVLKLSDQNIAISQSVSLFIQKFDKRPSVIIRRGINIEKIKKISPNQNIQEKYKNHTLIGFAGRLIDTKDIDTLITAFQKVVHKFPQKSLALFIIGEGPSKNKLEKLVQKINLEDKIIFTGQKNNQQTIALMKTFNIFVNPSRTEGLPTAVLEAGLCQNAIIATNVGGTAEIIQNESSGYLIKANDSMILSQRMIDLINYPDKIKLFGERAFQHIQKNFGWEKSINQYEKEFKKILAKK